MQIHRSGASHVDQNSTSSSPKRVKSGSHAGTSTHPSFFCKPDLHNVLRRCVISGNLLHGISRMHLMTCRCVFFSHLLKMRNENIQCENREMKLACCVACGLILLCGRHDAETRWVTCNKAWKHAGTHQKLHIRTLQLYMIHLVFSFDWLHCLCQYFLDTLVSPAVQKIAC